jgi:hypothetical protein
MILWWRGGGQAEGKMRLTLILTAWEFKKPFCKMKISPRWLKQNIFLKSKMSRKKS